jgi:hypothetical protein
VVWEAGLPYGWSSEILLFVRVMKSLRRGKMIVAHNDCTTKKNEKETRLAMIVGRSRMKDQEQYG